MYESLVNGIIVWDGWLGGVGIGLLMLSCFWITGKALGASRGYCAVLSPVSKLPFFTQNKKDFNFTRVWFLAGIPLGAAMAVLTSPDSHWSVNFSMGQYYDHMLPALTSLKTLTLFTGGVLLAFGSRMAGGCTSGNVIVGVSQLSLPSMVSGALFFLGGLFIVQLMFRVLS